MYHVIDAPKRHFQTIGIANVTDKVPDRRMLRRRKILPHIKLFQLIPAVYDQAFGLVSFQHNLDELFPKRARSARYKDAFAVQQNPSPSRWCDFITIYPRYRSPGENGSPGLLKILTACLRRI
jgi:hypothetical protein